MKRIYLIAICGTGMSALAGLLKEVGYEVRGSDVANYPPVKDLLADLKIPVCIGYDVEDLKSFQPDYVVIGNFVRRDNPQAQYVLEQKISYGSMASTLKEFFLQKTKNFVVLGTHGKSTTSTCLSHLLNEAKLEPGFFMGAVPHNFGRSFAAGKGDVFVLEGDEYDTAFFDKESKFLHYRPSVGIWMSLEFDHADIFPSMERLELMFRKFLKLLPAEGHLFYCSDWVRIAEILEEEKPVCSVTGFGFDEKADVRIENFEEDESGISFCLKGQNFHASMPSRFNAQNFAGAILAAESHGLPLAELAKALASFKGLKRRQEVRAQVGEHLVIDDFAHHPTAVEAVIKGLKAKYPRHQVVVLFEPRSNTARRKIFQERFVQALRPADLVLLPELFRSETLPEADRLDIRALVSSLKEQGAEASGPLKTEALVKASVEAATKRPSVFAVLSNGAFDGIHEKLISALENS